ncbi:MAG: M24 family metallopeptidase, partial [Candidatus Omnitrophica bacterium]|nr:M24 family metallopeptidase [Candidatus Omnitrophota bacterium]
KHSGYCADLTRVFFSGKMPILFKKVLDTVKKAQELAINKIKPGVKARDIDNAARNHIEKKGWGKYFGHGLGHGVGLSVHEPPFIGPNSNQILREGMVITIEPAIYLTGKFGIRIEDMVLVKKNKPEVLSKSKGINKSWV